MELPRQEQADIKKLLSYFVNQFREMGIIYKERILDIEGENKENREYREEILYDLNWKEKYLYKVLRDCITFGLIEHTEMGDELSGLKLTESGFNYVKPTNLNTGGQPLINIYKSNVSGQNIIGNNNQDISQNFYETIIHKIEAMEAPAAEKEQAKSLWKKVCENPMLCSVIGGIVSGVTGLYFPK